MNLEYKYLLDGNFHPDSRVWVYQSSRIFTVSEALQIEEMMTQFIHNWHSHGVPVKGAAHLFFGQFAVLIADETATGVSGCSTDSSVRLIKEIEKKPIIVAKALCIKYLKAASMPLFEFLFKPIKQYKHIFTISRNKSITNK